MRELYIYYRVRLEAEAPARDAVCGLHAELRLLVPGLQARWLKRADTDQAHEGVTPASEQTWMEIYTHTSGLSDADIALILAHGEQLMHHIAGPRHPEVFSPCA